MYVTSYQSGHFGRILELEEKVYPPALQFGRDVMQAELDAEKNRSLLIFDKGELAGYIIAYITGDPFDGETCYISDLNCTSKRALLLLLSSFFLGDCCNFNMLYEATCRPASFRLIQNRRFCEAITVIRQDKLEDYYAPGEDAYAVAFRVDRDKIKDWKVKFMHSLAKYEQMAGVKYFIGFAEGYKISDRDIRRSEKFVLRLLNEHNLSLYRMLGEAVPALVHKTIRFGTAAAAEGYAKTLDENGYVRETARISSEPGKYYIADLRLDVYDKYEYANTNSYGDLSSARHLLRRILRCSDKAEKSATIYDRYGVAYHRLTAPPYCNRRTWETAVGCYLERRRLDEKASAIRSYYSDMNKPSYRLKQLVQAVGLRDAVSLLDGILDRKLKSASVDTQDNYIHDWNVMIDRLLTQKAFLTKGAIIACLGGSYNAATKKAEIIEAVGMSVTAALRGRRKNSRLVVELARDTRKRLSRCVRTGQGMEEFAKEVSEKTARLNADRYKLTKQETEAAGEYMKRMERYIPYINTGRLFEAMGKTWVKRILAGKVECVFQPKVYTLGDDALCSEILDLLRLKTRQAKRVYSDLKSGKCLDAVKGKRLSDSQRGEVMRILRLRNCDISKAALGMSDFSARIEPKCSPEYLSAGDATVCCMGFGSDKANDYAREEGFGIFNVYYKDRVIANSVLWIDDGLNCLVLDNIEVHPNYQSCLGEIEQLYLSATSDILAEYRLNFAVQGYGYTDLKLKPASGIEVSVDKTKARRIGNKYFYSDAETVCIVNSAVSDDVIHTLCAPTEECVA